MVEAADKDGTGQLTEQEFLNSNRPGDIAVIKSIFNDSASAILIMTNIKKTTNHMVWGHFVLDFP